MKSSDHRCIGIILRWKLPIVNDRAAALPKKDYDINTMDINVILLLTYINYLVLLKLGRRHMPNTAVETELKVADEVWIAAALLHREHQEAQDFCFGNIFQGAKEEGLSKPFSTGSLRSRH